MERAQKGNDPVLLELRRLVERRQRACLWGRTYYVTPYVLPVVFGDGEQLLWWSTINSRPRWYVIQGDSGWNLDRGDVHEYTDRIEEALDDHFGRARGDDDEDEVLPWPAYDGETGCSWGRLWWRDLIHDYASAQRRRRGKDSSAPQEPTP